MIIESTRLIYRNLTHNDAEKILEIYSDREAMKYRESKPINNLNEARLMIEKAIAGIQNNIENRIAIEEKKSRELIGTFLYKVQKNDCCEIGYSLGKDYWGEGYGFEVLSTMIEFLQEKGFKILKARSHKDNIASRKLLTKAKFIEVEKNEKTNLHLFELHH